MRVSTNMIFDQGVRALQTQSAALLYTGQQIATGRKILTPADDPVASARALDVTQSRSVNKQFITNQGYAEDALKLRDVRQQRHVGQRQRVPRQQRSDHQRQRGGFGARNRNDALKRTTAGDFDPVHQSSLSSIGPASRRARARALRRARLARSAAASASAFF